MPRQYLFFVGRPIEIFRKMIRAKFFLAVLIVSFYAVSHVGTSHAQLPPGSGATLRELEKPDFRAPPPPTQTLPLLKSESDIPPAAVEPNDDERLLVRSLSVTGATSIPAEELSALLLPWVGRELSMNELKQAAARITQHYRDMGYLLARAYIPAQKPEDGAVKIAVLEGQLGALQLKNSSRIADDRLYALTRHLAIGKPVKSNSLERSILLLRSLPGVANVNAVLQPGEAVGTTALLIDVLQAPLITGSVDADNYGNSYTGTYRLGSTIYVNSPANLGDQLTLRLQASTHKLYYGRLAYQLPIGSSGLSGGLAYGMSSYHLGRQYEVLDANGSTQTIGAFLGYPFLLTQSMTVSGTLGVEQKQLRDRVDAFGLDSDKSAQVWSATLAANGATNKAIWSMNTVLSSGNLNIKTPFIRELDNAGPHTNGRYGKLTYNAVGLYRLTGPWSLFGAISGQFASKNLDSSEKFSLGGAEGVRAYPQGEGVGDVGLLATTELR